MYCHKCGKLIDDNVDYCPYCGIRNPNKSNGFETVHDVNGNDIRNDNKQNSPDRFDDGSYEIIAAINIALAFFVPPLGFIFAIVLLVEKKGKKAYSVISLIVSLLAMVTIVALVVAFWFPIINGWRSIASNP